MYSKGIFMFKGIEKREGGTFKNSNGQEVNYDASYVIKVDEIYNGQINERKMKFPVSNKVLFDKFAQFEPYTKVSITCDVQMLQSGSKLIPIDVEEYDPDNE